MSKVPEYVVILPPLFFVISLDCILCNGFRDALLLWCRLIVRWKEVEIASVEAKVEYVYMYNIYLPLLMRPKIHSILTDEKSGQ